MRITFVSLLVALLVSAPAQAAPRTVARVGEFTLQAELKRGELCITLRKNRHYQGEECGPIPRSPHRPLHMFPAVGFNNYAVAVPPSVAYVDRESPGGQHKRYQAFAAEGFAAHFVIIPTPPGVKFVRFYAADGTLLGIDGGQAGYIGFDDNVQWLVGERGNGVEVHTEPLITPTPDQADRIATLACARLTNSGGGNGVCNRDSDNQIVVVGSCDGPDLVGGVLAQNVSSLRLTLGSGAQFAVPITDLPAPFSGSRGFGANVPAGEAVREAVAFDAAGQPLARTTVGTAPGGQPCAGTDQGDDDYDGSLEPIAPPANPVPVGTAGSVPLLVADDGERLCVALGGLGAGTCPSAPVDSDDPELIRRADGVAAALSGDADRVTLRFDRGDPVTVRTIAYTGRWAAKVRFLAAPVPAGRKITRVIVRNAAGAVIGIGGGPRRMVTKVRALADGLELVRNVDGWPCVTATVEHSPAFCTDPDPGTQIDGPYLPYTGAVVVTCEPRRAIAYGRFPDKMVTPRGARRIKLPGDDAWYAVLPDAPVTELRAGKRSVPLQLPPAGAQCGYDLVRRF